MSTKRAVIVKGTNEGILMTLEPDATFEEIKEQLLEILGRKTDIFRKTTITLDTSRHLLPTHELRDIVLLFSEHDAKIHVKPEDRDTRTLEEKPPEKQKMSIQTDRLLSLVQDRDDITVLPMTARSGQVVLGAGDVVILGDINEGAEVQAERDLFVFGVIRGNAFAKESIVALGFESGHIVVGGLVYKPGETGGRLPRKPQVMYVSNQHITIEPVGKIQPYSTL